MTIETDQQLHKKDLSAYGGERNIRVVNHINEPEWKQFVDGHPQGNIFHTPEMFAVFSRTKGFQPKLWAAVADDGQIVALFLPVFVTLNKLLGPLAKRAIAYGSVLCAPTTEGRNALAMLLNTYLKENRGKCLFTELRNVSDMESEQQVLLEQDFHFQEYLNYLVDLKHSPEEVFSRIGHRTQRNIKRGLNKGDVVVHEVTDARQIGICYDLLSQTYQAARVPLSDRSLFESAFELLQPQKMIRFSLAYVGDSPAAVSVELLYKNTMYGWFGGMNRAYSRFNPNEMLMWQILKWGSENGYSLYDFGGAGKPNETYGVRDFKAKFGGQLVCYGRNTHVHLPGVLWLSTLGYNFVRHLFNGRLIGSKVNTNQNKINEGEVPNENSYCQSD